MASGNVRITPDKRLIAILIYVTAFLQVVGFYLSALSSPNIIANALVRDRLLTPLAFSAINHTYIGFMIFGLVWAFFRWSPRPFYLMGTGFLCEAVLKLALSQEGLVPLALLYECARYFWFFVIGYALRNARTLDVEIGLPSVRVLLRCGLALSFIALGFESLMNLGHTHQLVLNVQKALSSMPSPASSVMNLLSVAAAINILVGFLVLLRPTRKALVFVAFWGIMTAVANRLIFPLEGYFEILLQAPNFMLPLLIMVIEGQRSIRKPIRRFYLRTLRKISFIHPPWA